MQTRPKCKLAVCACSARADDPYCSDHCSEAAAVGVERDFCACPHAECSGEAHVWDMQMISAAGLPDSISFRPGSVTIEYSDQANLRDQLVLLATKLEAEDGIETSQQPLSKAPGRVQKPPLAQSA